MLHFLASDFGCNIIIVGVSGVAHVASVSPLIMSSKKEEVIDPTVNGTLSILRTAAKQSTVKRFVLTSSTISVIWPKVDVELNLTKDSWNEESVENAYNMKDDNPYKPWHVYGASKVLGEKAAWKFVQEEKPNFVLNTIISGANLGPILDLNGSLSSGAYIRQAYHGDIELFKMMPPRK